MISMEIGLNTYSIRKLPDILSPDIKKLPQAIVNICKDTNISKVELFDKHFLMDDVKRVQKIFEDNGIDWFAFGAHCKVLVKPSMVEEKAKEYKKWFELAHETGIKYIRFQMNSGDMPKLWPPMDDFTDEEWDEYNKTIDRGIEQVKPSMDHILDIIDDYDVRVGLETHGSFSSNYLFMEKFNKLYNHPKIKWIYDIGNYRDSKMRFRALEELKEKIWYIHAAAYSFDENGFESSKNINYPKAAKVLKDEGYAGIWSIEFKGPDKLVGIHRTKELIVHALAKVNGEKYEIQTDFPTNEELIEKYKV